jgi:hypothetical protein
MMTVDETGTTTGDGTGTTTVVAIAIANARQTVATVIVIAIAMIGASEVVAAEPCASMHEADTCSRSPLRNSPRVQSGM